MSAQYHNEEMPDRIPKQNQGRIPVIARLVDDENGVHYRPAEARRWTSTHVMVDVHHTGALGRDRLAWLRAQDVHRILRTEHTGLPIGRSNRQRN
ncbi:hypothetical protein CLV30_101129 [Haloactinopolyspora alba]|uniref:Uncharacterized protein n=1 Tax=Haloactinopolyspora alba TaxID=648780 RepID=A0A2P8EFA9_9ACTN|nr:hypothetical protein [Haloactinopolyspora alba]PSL08162.1 hypothetical protein CLV30_101129 [Haloactinopolyspora alba]